MRIKEEDGSVGLLDLVNHHDAAVAAHVYERKKRIGRFCDTCIIVSPRCTARIFEITLLERRRYL